ncbi:NUDIX domain-containing protein [Krasilnikovia sp. MM14-A1259]|uniref:NUDIX domain-containing protein n=1 Tax=Krasilnikovia sp. MM14-A1259 TaxID=3373539 RepID=UPI0038178837
MHTAADGVAIDIITTGDHWQSTWYPPSEVPTGTPHGSTGVCVVDGQVILVSHDRRYWEFPGGRPEAGEDWADTLVREVSEEACATVLDCRLLGFSRGVCLRGPEKGLVLVRALWRAEVRLGEWMPEHEMVERRLVNAERTWDALSLTAGWKPIYRRILAEAGIPAGE